MIEYIPFTSDREVNRQALRQGLPQGVEPTFIAVHFGTEVMKEVRVFIPEGCFISSAEVYEDAMNMFVKENVAVPAVGFIRVRKAEDSHVG